VQFGKALRNEDSSVIAWLMMVKDKPVALSAGYLDDVSRIYRWDDTVPNYERPSPGDVVILWDSHQLLGVSIIEAIETSAGQKVRFRCPECNHTDLRERKSKKPVYKCGKCKIEIDEPKEQSLSVVTYHASYDSSWVDLSAELNGPILRSLCRSPKSQHSIRAINYARFLDKLPSTLQMPIKKILSRGASPIPSGHTPRVQKVRNGQPTFRRQLLKKYGEICVLSGSAPRDVLDAAHLYSYAELEKHYLYGGLLIRKDLHRLFDLGRIRIDPKSLNIFVNDSLFEYPVYRSLHGKPISVEIEDETKRWIKIHWDFYTKEV
jgi:transcription elongation factor Elf1